MRKHSKAQIIISALAVINVVCVPIFDVWGGLFPGIPDDNFFDVIAYLFSGIDAWSYNVVRFTAAIFIPSLFMFIFSVIGLKKAAKISAAAGILWLAVELVLFVIEYGIDYLFDFDDGNISIGLWIGLALFIAMMFVKTKKPSAGEAASAFPDKE